MTEVGIALCGGYLPAYRIDRDLIAASWGRSSLGGERTLANNDEDGLTLKSTLDRVKGLSRKTALIISADCRQGYLRSDYK